MGVNQSLSISKIGRFENEKIDLIVWHPLFAKMEEQNRWAVLFLFLDEVLGEFGTQQWVGEIKLNDQGLTEAMPLQELQPFVKALETETGWKKYPPGEIWTGYRFEKTQYDFLRGDIFIGTTSHIAIVNDYVRSKGELPDPLENTGADFVFISFPAAFLPEGNQSEARGKIEDALNQELRLESSGHILLRLPVIVRFLESLFVHDRLQSNSHEFDPASLVPLRLFRRYHASAGAAVALLDFPDMCEPDQ